MRRAHADYHDEIVAALREIGNPRVGAAVAKDRGSTLDYLGVRFPALRKRVKQGFSFYELSEDEILSVWDGMWRVSPYGEVLFAALEYYAPIVRKRVSSSLWPVVRHWPDRVDNWCHCDGLSSLYSWILASDGDEVYAQLEVWNRAENQWLRRISIVSLIHYSGKNAVFMPLERVLPLVTTCLDDEREYVQRAVGWVLREMGAAYPEEVRAYLVDQVGNFSTVAFRRAIELRSSGEQAELLALKRELGRDPAAGAPA